MNGLTLEQEAALTFAWMSQPELPKNFSKLGMSDAFIALRDKGYVDLQTDSSCSLIFLKSVTEPGGRHYDQARKQRRSFVAVDDDADELMMMLAAQGKRLNRQGPFQDVQTDIKGPDSYAALANEGLIEAQWGDDAPYHVTVTDKGRSYAEGRFLEENGAGLSVNVTNNIVNNNASNSSSSASIHDVTLEATISSIVDLNIGAKVQQAISRALKEFDAAARTNNSAKLSGKLEKVAGIIKNFSALANVVLPYIGTALGTFLK